MMSNKEIASFFKLLSKLMDIHGENPFKIRSYQNASFTLERLEHPVSAMADEDRAAIKGIGDAISAKIREILTTGQLSLLNKYLANTPEGVVDMLQISGLGGKKIAVIWKEMGIESIGELLYACYENRLARYKGFGQKSQDNIIKAIEYLLANQDKVLYAQAETEALWLMEQLAALPWVKQVEPTGAYRRKDPVLESVELLVACDGTPEIPDTLLTISSDNEDSIGGHTATGLSVILYITDTAQMVWQQYLHTGTEAHLAQTNAPAGSYTDELAIYQQAGKPYIIPEMRHGIHEWEWFTAHNNDDLIAMGDIKGVVHAHSTWSDGTNTLEDLAKGCMDLGYEYLAITDHSQTAFYANGLTDTQIRAQHEEVSRLNQVLAPFRIFHGIESDILTDGSLDYQPEILHLLDFVIASVHSNLKMPQEKAMSRLTRAIQNPYTTMMGHLTGRLLLSRDGYPVDHAAVIDLCARLGVAIELNANPYRLDMDWSWIPYAMKKNVMMAINPDAHSIAGIQDIRYGVMTARKGGLLRSHTLNAKSAMEFAAWLQQKKPAVLTETD